ncbi:MAG: M15 family metallopeptidase [Eubacteriales bacterium]|nr:M15 family metallopeptidase [Eubacteriales bacterium]
MIDFELERRNRIKTAAAILCVVAAGAAAGYGVWQQDFGTGMAEIQKTGAAQAEKTGLAAAEIEVASVSDRLRSRELPEGTDLPPFNEEFCISPFLEKTDTGESADEDRDADNAEEDRDGDSGGEEDEVFHFIYDSSVTDDWRLILVNPWNELPEDFEVETDQTEYGWEFDARAVDDLEEMLSDCREEGHSPLICSAYRSHEYQANLFEKDVRRWIYRGYPEEEAREETARSVAVPGTSEHEAGLAVDIVYSGMQVLEEWQADNDTQQWLMEHCWEYGFILRYPEDKTEITGITYEPWHYRYVGKKAAKYMNEHNMCLEEYLQYLSLLSGKG